MLQEPRAYSKHAGPYARKYSNNFHELTNREHKLLINQSDAIIVENARLTTLKAVLLLLLGTIIAVVFSYPLVDAVDNFSNATNIPSFFTSFIMLPLATRSSKPVSAIIFASQKKLRSASLTLSE
ncbi:sodium/calcium exchanger family protein/calcium-binding EF hand family protein [Forsythia ovata]|uniref:Sodium/calcium exchanger family protein/calcium-binding EF hand family protein n=1 Tax=Forsythia ovata TaxID=205694 RepID=A0ABD1WU69_9LAMI